MYKRQVLIQESKVGTCDVQPGRRPVGPALLALVERYRQRAGLTGGHQTPIRTTRAGGEGEVGQR